MQDQNYYRVFNPTTGMLLFDFYGGLADLMAKVYDHVDMTGSNVISIAKHTRSMTLMCEFEGGSNED
jgi:hypothetical protein